MIDAAPGAFERFEVLWSGNTCYVGTEKGSGGGAARALSFLVGGASKWNINVNGDFIAQNDNANSIGQMPGSR